LSDLPPGKHTFKCKVWDIYNNFGSDETVGFVTPGRQLKINEHGVFPNPISENGKLWFSHTLPGEDLTVNWEIVNTSGLIVASGSKFIESSFAVSKVTLDGIIPENPNERSMEYTHVLSPGLYLYRIKLQSVDGLHSTVGGKILYQPK